MDDLLRKLLQKYQFEVAIRKYVMSKAPKPPDAGSINFNPKFLFNKDTKNAKTDH